MTAPAKKRKPRKVVVWAVVAGSGVLYSYHDRKTVAYDSARAHWQVYGVLARVVRCEGVLR